MELSHPEHLTPGNAEGMTTRSASVRKVDASIAHSDEYSIKCPARATRSQPVGWASAPSRQRSMMPYLMPYTRQESNKDKDIVPSFNTINTSFFTVRMEDYTFFEE